MFYGPKYSEALDSMLRELSLWDSAMELDMTTPTLTEQAKKSKASSDKTETVTQKTESVDPIQNAIDKANTMSEEMLQAIESKHETCYKLLTNTWRDNEEFVEQYNEMKNTYKLQKEIKVINWTYGHDMTQYLHAKVASMRSIMTKNANLIGNWQKIGDDDLLNKSGTEMDKQLCADLGAPSSITTLNEYSNHLRTQFRGKKGEMVYKGDMAKKYVLDVRNFAKTKTTYTQDITAAERVTKSMQNTLKSKLRNSSLSDTDRGTILKLATNALRMVTFYINLIYFVYRMECEFIINRRAIITQLYEK